MRLFSTALSIAALVPLAAHVQTNVIRSTLAKLEPGPERVSSGHPADEK